jgi:hypothetical protein
MTINRFKPEIWSASLLVALRQNLIYTAFINRDYEGEISEAGDTVRITSIGRPTINTYVPNSTVITPEQVNDSQRTLVVDQSKYFAFAVDDVDARQAKGNVIPQAMDEAAFAAANVIDQYISSFYTTIQTANQLGAITVNSSTTPTDAYDKVLVPLKIRVGRAAGFDILLSNQTPTTGSDSVVIAGNDRAITFADQISKVEAYRPQSSFSDAVKGLFLYGAKTVRNDSLASALVTVS